ncbi:hypothetical protein [Flavihumibacter sp. CACIAM 22H1]|uniref:hypothetical protein n=1 Tax=Flavihumibacter sp. CACIAM 22H1 TaxID=1812911 RepID=UPI0007A7C838|nr:hypothetical protein [Flavihumibacter sp. CACIAM 22H1]KYP16632.1 MAG: hypothetical protein A1D16_09475 [Flavihumibacter sp. CACIAM 22H1]
MNKYELTSQAQILASGYNKGIVTVNYDDDGITVIFGKKSQKITPGTFRSLDDFSRWFQEKARDIRQKRRLLDELSREIQYSSWVYCQEIQEDFVLTLKCGSIKQVFKIIAKSEVQTEAPKGWILLHDIEQYHDWLSKSIEKAIKEMRKVPG